MMETVAAPVGTTYGLPPMAAAPMTMQTMGVPVTTMAAPTVL